MIHYANIIDEALIAFKELRLECLVNVSLPLPNRWNGGNFWLIIMFQKRVEEELVGLQMSSGSRSLHSLLLNLVRTCFLNHVEDETLSIVKRSWQCPQSHDFSRLIAPLRFINEVSFTPADSLTIDFNEVVDTTELSWLWIIEQEIFEDYS